MRKQWSSLFLIPTFLWPSLAGFAASPSSPETAPYSKEMRQKMAEAHMKMADCLKSDKTMEECRTMMQTECRGMMKEYPKMQSEGCPMGPMGPMGPGRRGMMGQ